MFKSFSLESKSSGFFSSVPLAGRLTKSLLFEQQWNTNYANTKKRVLGFQALFLALTRKIEILSSLSYF